MRIAVGYFLGTHEDWGGASRALLNFVRKIDRTRFRPIVLTALALVAGGGVILLDPIFQGLAVALISGVLVSTALTLIVIPLLYYMYLKTVGTADIQGEES